MCCSAFKKLFYVLLFAPDAHNELHGQELDETHLTAHGVMDPAALYESPFTDLNAQGPEGVFSSVQVDELILLLSQVRARAVA